MWLYFLTAILGVSIFIWLLDRFSPYSYHNNKDKYREVARDFTLAESLWFSFSSVTPQGGGECPKAGTGQTVLSKRQNMYETTNFSRV